MYSKGSGAGGWGRETMNKMKRQPSEWENIFENDVTDKGLLSNIQALHEAHHKHIHINNAQYNL